MDGESSPEYRETPNMAEPESDETRYTPTTGSENESGSEYYIDNSESESRLMEVETDDDMNEEELDMNRFRNSAEARTELERVQGEIRDINRRIRVIHNQFVIHMERGRRAAEGREDDYSEDQIRYFEQFGNPDQIPSPSEMPALPENWEQAEE